MNKKNRNRLYWALFFALLVLPAQWKSLYEVSKLSMPHSIEKDYVPKRFEVQVLSRFFDNRLKGVSIHQQVSLAKHLLALCEQYSFDPALILSLIQAESSFRNGAKSQAGARGLMQLMPETAKFIAKKRGLKYKAESDLSNPFVNISLGIAYLDYLRKRYQGSLTYFLVAYNAGPTRVDRLISANRFTHLKYPMLYAEKVRRGAYDMRKLTFNKKIAL